MRCVRRRKPIRAQVSAITLSVPPSHGGNRGSNPLGDANDINGLADDTGPKRGRVSNLCPIYSYRRPRICVETDGQSVLRCGRSLALELRR